MYVHYRQNYEHMNIIYTIAMESKVHRKYFSVQMGYSVFLDEQTVVQVIASLLFLLVVNK